MRVRSRSHQLATNQLPPPRPPPPPPTPFPLSLPYWARQRRAQTRPMVTANELVITLHGKSPPPTRHLREHPTPSTTLRLPQPTPDTPRVERALDRSHSTRGPHSQSITRLAAVSDVWTIAPLAPLLSETVQCRAVQPRSAVPTAV